VAISPGTRFGPYEVDDEIGAGGMGVVYQATDTTLDREVAIKVLPESMASDAERITRFDRSRYADYY
jgi:serine/threonine protein kinase